MEERTDARIAAALVLFALDVVVVVVVVVVIVVDTSRVRRRTMSVRDGSNLGIRGHCHHQDRRRRRRRRVTPRDPRLSRRQIPARKTRRRRSG